MSALESGRSDDVSVPDLVPRTAVELDEPALKEDSAWRVEGARTRWLDAEALGRDFPWLRARAERSSDGAMDFWARWLVENAALISQAQAGQAVVNEEIRTTGSPREVFRLPRGGRAFCAPVMGVDGDPPGLLALKGVGVGPGRVPSNGDYRNGLMRLGSALEEVLSQQLFERILRHTDNQTRCLPVYGVVDLGFDLRDGDRSLGSAGVLVRRAHRRPLKGVDHPFSGSRTQQVGLQLELLLRRYGLSSTSVEGSFILKRSATGEVTKHYFNFGELLQGAAPSSMVDHLWQRYGHFADDDSGDLRFVGINLQATREEDGVPLQLLDFGGLRAVPRFRAPMVSRVRDRAGNWGGVLAPDSPSFVQPEPDLLVPYGYWEPHPWSARDPEEMEYLFGCREASDLALNPDEPMELWDALCRWLEMRSRAEDMTVSEVDGAIERYVQLTTRHLEG